MLLYFYKIKLFSRTKSNRDKSFTQRVEKYKFLNLVETFYGCKQPQKVRIIQENDHIGWTEAENSEKTIFAIQKYNKLFVYLHFHEELLY